MQAGESSRHRLGLRLRAVSTSASTRALSGRRFALSSSRRAIVWSPRRSALIPEPAGRKCAPMHTRHLVQKYTPVPLHCFRSVTSNSCDAWAPPTHRARCDDPAAHAVPAEARRGSTQLANPGATPAACLRPGRCEPQGQLAWPVRDFLSLASGAVPTSTQRHTPHPQHGSGTWHRCRRQHISHCCDRGGATFYS